MASDPVTITSAERQTCKSEVERESDKLPEPDRAPLCPEDKEKYASLYRKTRDSLLYCDNGLIKQNAFRWHLQNARAFLSSHAGGDCAPPPPKKAVQMSLFKQGKDISIGSLNFGRFGTHVIHDDRPVAHVVRDAGQVYIVREGETEFHLVSGYGGDLYSITLRLHSVDLNEWVKRDENWDQYLDSGLTRENVLQEAS
ncbi:MAG: hypothetical protein Q7T11_09340 [Deltaproteobacteria bacterium]|nr:hypothetical protein [Deltaproteobacteria bacterium]